MTASAAAGIVRLRERIDSIPEALRRFAAAGPVRLRGGFQPRAIATTGLGSSAAHARFLAHLLAAHAGVPARFVETGALAAGPPAEAARDSLVVFSQGLSPNSRFALVDAAAWGECVLVTAQGAEGDDERAEWRRALEAAGVTIVSLPAAGEYGMLVRTIGPMVGFAAALAVGAEIVRARGSAPGIFELDLEVALERIERAPRTLAEALRAHPPVADWLGGELALVASGGYGELVQHLRTKILEGTLSPLPPLWDELAFAHGGFQRTCAAAGTVLHLARAGSDEDARLRVALEAALDPERHRVITLEAALPGAAAVFEHEALGNALLLEWLEAVQSDPREWPGRGADGALYECAPPLAGLRPWRPRHASTERASSALASWTSPEIAEALREGGRSAVIALGSIEQHGPHLPLATDAWIAEALAERVAARIPAALCLPVLPFGCASEHMGFAGTLSLGAETFVAVLCDLLRSLATHGFRDALVFTAHGGNTAFLRDAEDALAKAAAPMPLCVFTEHDELWRDLSALSRELGSSPEAAGHHAGELETSILAALHPASVRRDRLEAGLLVPDSAAEVQSLFHPSLDTHAPGGVIGDPRGARAERAEPYLEAWVDALVAAYEARRAIPK